MPEIVRDKLLEFGVGILVAIVMVVSYVIRRSRFKWMESFDFTPIVEDHLERFGITLISLRSVDKRAANPFDGDTVHIAAGLRSFEALSEGRAVTVAEYRIAECYDSSGQKFELWVQIDSQPRITGERSIRYRSGNPQSLPPKVQLILS